MLVKNTFTHDARVWREARTLQMAGHQVQVVALAAPNLPVTETTSDGIQITRVSRGPGAKLLGVSDPTNSVSNKSKQRNVMKRTAVQIVKLAAKTPISKYVQSGIDQRMKAVVLAFGPDVVHAHDLETLELACTLKFKLKIPVVYDSHEIASERNHHSPAQRNRAGAKEEKLIPYADAVIMVSEGCANFTANKYGISLPNVILNIPDFDPEKMEVRDLRKALRIPAINTVLVHQGSLQKNRGIEQSIEALRDIPNVTYVIIGYGQHRPYLEDYVARSGLSEKIKFFGPVPSSQLIDWATSADIGICTVVGKTKSYLYAMPNKLFEYTMAGLPVIASDYPDIGKFVAENKMGLTCDPESSSDIGAAIKTLVRNPELRAKFAEGARIARTKFNWANEQKKLLEIYSRL
ncbi:MAG: glycosyltransferase family 1 protein [Actinobacteria bacterium]|nr:glycosyltransferase family 1 protein [Actinomycetota bacterium]